MTTSEHHQPRKRKPDVSTLTSSESCTVPIKKVQQLPRSDRRVDSMWSVASVTVNREVRIIDLVKGPPGINPFTTDTLRWDVEVQSLLIAFGEEMSLPLERDDDLAHYRPCQRLADFIREAGYDGIRYPSALNPDCTNVVFFDPTVATIGESKLVKIRRTPSNTKRRNRSNPSFLGLGCSTGRKQLSMAFEFRITATFAPDDMMRFGPLIKGRVALPTSKDPKDGIEGYFLIDTGASNCFIDQSVAADLGITSLGPVTSHGLGGAVEVQRHKVMLFIPAKPLKGNLPPQALAMLGFVQEVGTVDINTHHEGLENIPGRVLGALGRNILRFTRSVYDGTTGTITIETDEAMRLPRPAVTSYNDAVKRLLSIAVEKGFKTPFSSDYIPATVSHRLIVRILRPSLRHD